MTIGREDIKREQNINVCTIPPVAKSYRDGLIKFTASNSLILQAIRPSKIDGTKLKPLLNKRSTHNATPQSHRP